MSYYKRPLALVVEYPGKRRAVVTSTRGASTVRAAILAADVQPTWSEDDQGWIIPLARVADVCAALDALDVYYTTGKR